MARGSTLALYLTLSWVALSVIVVVECENDMMRVLDAISEVGERLDKLEAKVGAIDTGSGEELPHEQVYHKLHRPSRIGEIESAHVANGVERLEDCYDCPGACPAGMKCGECNLELGKRDCHVCAAGSRSLHGVDDCTKCPEGKTSGSGSPTCDVCPYGKHANEDQSECIKNSTGTGSAEAESQAYSSCTGPHGCPPFNCTAYPTSARFDPETEVFRFANCGKTKQQGGDLDPSITCPDASMAAGNELHIKSSEVDFFADGCAACPKGWLIDVHKGHNTEWEKIVCKPPRTTIETVCAPPYINNMDAVTEASASAKTRTPISCTTAGPVSMEQYFVVDPNPPADCTDCDPVHFFRHEITCMMVKRTLCATVTSESSLEAYQSPSTPSAVINTVGRRCASVKQLAFQKLVMTYARVRAANATKEEENVFQDVSWDVTSISPKNGQAADVQAKLNATELPSEAVEFYMNTVWPGFVNHDNNYGACSGSAQN